MDVSLNIYKRIKLPRKVSFYPEGFDFQTISSQEKPTLLFVDNIINIVAKTHSIHFQCLSVVFQLHAYE